MSLSHPTGICISLRFDFFFLLANNKEQLFRIRPGKRLAGDQAEQAAREPFEEQPMAKAEG